MTSSPLTPDPLLTPSPQQPDFRHGLVVFVIPLPGRSRPHISPGPAPRCLCSKVTFLKRLSRICPRPTTLVLSHCHLPLCSLSPSPHFLHFNTGSLCSPGWPRTCLVDQAGTVTHLPALLTEHWYQRCAPHAQHSQSKILNSLIIFISWLPTRSLF